MEDQINAIRRFSRTYTRHIGALHERLHDSTLSLAEARLLAELAHLAPTTATALRAALALDPAYISRILARFAELGLIERRRSDTDARQTLITLTADGQTLFDKLDGRAKAEMRTLLAQLDPPARTQLVTALGTAERLLAPAAAPPIQLRPHRIGDMGWITHRQALLYAEEYGWDEQYEALVAAITSQFLQDYDPASERSWIAERDGIILGAVFLVRDTDERANLRLLYVEPDARNLGLGRRLLDECVHTARELGYATLTLWTHDCLTAARNLYQRAGFVLAASEPRTNFGHEMMSETWELPLVQQD